MMSLINILLLGLTIYFEAGGESYLNQVACGCVIRNRVNSDLFADSYYDVVFQPRHFSCYNLNEVDKHIGRLVRFNRVEVKSLIRCVNIADSIYNGYIEDITDGSLWYSLKYRRKFGKKVRLFKVWQKDLKVKAEYGMKDNPTVFYGM